ncbi:hypothetical protein GSI_14583 [Ganoderma sinense ZZ0214-1]|uniref:Uncharacterized protein n=1 Tax=Ganoderma sinense ZZ0214-1 TaxID=1077348 RepID=A0A2G8RP54_9APHY|nr:hypothetical protein GSI_14583 [Ganoderma sinense ZZ0214-1]
MLLPLRLQKLRRRYTGKLTLVLPSWSSSSVRTPDMPMMPTGSPASILMPLPSWSKPVLLPMPCLLRSPPSTLARAFLTTVLLRFQKVVYSLSILRRCHPTGLLCSMFLLLVSDRARLPRRTSCAYLDVGADAFTNFAKLPVRAMKGLVTSPSNPRTASRRRRLLSCGLHMSLKTHG